MITTAMPIWSYDTLAWARFYISLGLCPIPAAYGGKNAIVKWRGLKNPTLIEGWFDGGRRPNVAIICGAASGNLVVLDHDDPAVYYQFWDTDQLERRTLVVRTGGGKRQIYFRTPAPVPSFKIPKLRLEVRAEGNIVIAPPSLHAADGRYEFVNPEVNRIAVVKDLIPTIWKVAGEKFGVRRPRSLPEKFGGSKPRPRKPWRGRHPPCIRKLLEGVDQGFRNEAALRLAGYFLLVRDLESCKVLEILKCWNRRNRPPLPGRELERVFRSSLHRGYLFGCRGLATFCSDPKGCPFMQKYERYWFPSRWSWRLGNGLP
jgi:hypothetical protein